MDTSNFKVVFLGQSVLRYKVPLDVYNIINNIYEKKYPELFRANNQLVGKIEKEHSLLFNGEDLLELAPEERAHKGVFMSFQYPVEIPGISVSNFIKTSISES